MDTQSFLPTFLIAFLVIALIFLILRELVTWYWKINKIVMTLERIDNNLEYIARLLKAQSKKDIEQEIDKMAEETPEQ